jgi:outer membrane receptor protein involved in Fe transport
MMTYQFSEDNNHRSQNSCDIFAQWDYTPSDHWDIIGGLRYDYFSAAKKGRPTWKLAAMYKTGKHQIRVSYASGFRAPSLKELYMDFFMGGIFMIYGNTDLKCETNHNLSLSWTNHGSVSDNLKYCLTATGYYNFFNNYITTATVQRDGKTAQMYTNIANQQIAGVDASVQLHHQNGIGAKVSYAFTKNIVKKGQPDLTAARPHSLTWRIDYDRQFTEKYGLYVALSGRFLSAVDVTEYASTELDEMTKMGDLSVGTLKTIGEILDAIKDIETIDAMSQGGYSGEYANEGGNSMRGRYYRDGYAREGSYEGNSYRKRNRMGQFSRYSRAGESDQLVEKIETLMDDTTNGGDREKIRNQIMEVMDKYK